MRRSAAILSTGSTFVVLTLSFDLPPALITSRRRPEVLDLIAAPEARRGVLEDPR
jgi:hypothetical protein